MFKRKNLQNSVRAGALAVATAMTGMGAAGLSTSASAVSIAHDGLGEVMIFPYYTARNGFASFFNITNTSEDTVLLKVRWNEGENSRDARDFNVILSPHDVWAVATVGDRDTDFARYLTVDNTCTAPVLGVTGTTGDGKTQRSGLLTDFAYTGKNDDTGSQTADRTAEGYFTVFQMGVIDSSDLANNAGIYTNASSVATTTAQLIVDSAKHSNVRDNQGVPGADTTTATRPTNCGVIDKLFANNIANIKLAATEPRNVLKGRAVLIELNTGVAHGYDPVTLFDFFTPDGAGSDGTSSVDLISTASTKQPNLNNAKPVIASFVNNGLPVNQVPAAFLATVPGSTLLPGSGRPVDAVTALLARKSIINDYNVNTDSETDWVITFPTKAFYVDRNVNGISGANFFQLPQSDTTPLAPFAETFYDRTILATGATVDGPAAGESCIKITPDLWDREEFQGENVASNFSPKTSTANTEICKEANILSFGTSNIFDSQLRSALYESNPGGLPGTNGWGRLTFDVQNTAATATFTGIPVVGMRLEARKNPKYDEKRFGFSSEHAYER